MHPGSVQGFGLLGENRTTTFLLPSNPVAALVVFETFVRPLIRLSLGKRVANRRVVRARALNHIESRPGRRGFIRARLMRDAETSDYLVEGLSGATGAPAHLLAGLAEANALVRIPEDVTSIRPGDVVDVIFLSPRPYSSLTRFVLPLWLVFSAAYFGCCIGTPSIPSWSA